tara:strand:- start:4096 stop:4383 length:288 start_codon:yes stop_codon:yes gene_type:complete
MANKKLRDIPEGKKFKGLRLLPEKVRNRFNYKAAGKKVVKVKGVDVSDLTKRQQKTLKAHSVHHTKKHMKAMVDDMKKGVTFGASHKKAQKKVGN